ncbi:MAG: anthranilate synthase component II, partial [Bacteroidales bacterium]
MQKILLLDNYDSFTYNLYHYVQAFNGVQVDVFRNDRIAIEDIEKYNGIILSPGPGLPRESGPLIPIIERYKSTKRILGICLGQQAIAEVYGGKLVNLDTVYHGVATPININAPKHYIFRGLPNKIEVGRYHSWAVSIKNLPECLKIEATDNDGIIMALSHKELDICAVQFHP